MTFSETVADAAAWLNDFGKYQMVMANFCELVAEGVPDDGKIRDYVTDDQAEACFKRACEIHGMLAEEAYDIVVQSPAERRETVHKVADLLGLTRVIRSRLLASEGPRRLD